jgi:hypothetical protein
MKKSGTTKNNEHYSIMNKKNFSFSKYVDEVESNREQKQKEKTSNLINSKENLRCLVKNFKKYDIESFDIETTGRGNYFFLFGYIDKYGVYHYSFDKMESINLINRSKHRGTRIYATNLGFDFNALTEGTDFKNKCNIIIRGNNYVMVKFRGTYHDVRLLDTTNYGGLSVQSMGKILKLMKIKPPRCLGRKPKNKKELKELIEYNKRDCEISKSFMELLQRGLNVLGGELRPTISSCALDLFRREFLEFDVYRESLILGFDVRDKIFKAYYGGRTETFKRGIIEDYNYYDFNSLYPSVMLLEYPDPITVGYEKNENRELLKYEGVSYFEIETPYTKYPLLPFRNKENKLLFPYGLMKGYYTHLEIREQLKNFPETKILLMKDTVYYTGKRKYFYKYVTTLYELRKKYKAEGNEMEHVVKLLLNSLYGRFALRRIEKTEFVNFDNEEEAIKKVKECEAKGIRVKCNSVNDAYYSETEEFDGSSSIPIWSVYVTAYARIKLFNAIKECEPVYVDTDSLITKETYKDSKELGELKLEKKIKKGIIIKPKLYFCDDEIKSKGVPIPKDVKGKIRLKKHILEGKTLHYKKFIKVKEGITRDIKVNSVIVQSKNIDLKDTKREWKGEFSAFELQDSEPIKITQEDY